MIWGAQGCEKIQGVVNRLFTVRGIFDDFIQQNKKGGKGKKSHGLNSFFSFFAGPFHRKGPAKIEKKIA